MRQERPLGVEGGARSWKVEGAYGGCEWSWLWCCRVIGSKGHVSFSGPHLQSFGVYLPDIFSEGALFLSSMTCHHL